MFRGNLGLLEGGADLAGSVCFLEMEDLEGNGAGAHDDEKGDAAEDDDRYDPRLLTAGLPALDEGLFALRADEGSILGNGQHFIAVGEEAAGEVGAFTSAGHRRIQARGSLEGRAKWDKREN